ncbi:Conserved hypothetical protein [Xanthomonas translucens pv. translucens DSM 18974]|uniref:Uncharacterized protein n=1 Tax=Xanthomonas translucens pv. translucens DSM 18974 TaxID=1261556 RepID=A0A1C3TNC3_XANCT|nr:hypothetical protein BN444_00261 [Xanthomonas translucens pv. translucens DSM 18974]SCB04764.1 Conserved hypothetical protein [Xanthomonas translucens pv. translucens DSM 18974]
MAKKLVQRYIGVDDPKQRPLVRFRLDDLWGDAYIRNKGKLHIRHVATQDLVYTDIDRYEMVVFDGGNTSGKCWKHVFFPRQRTHCFVYDA